MQKIAIINGTSVYSDKGTAMSIIGTQIRFPDGSWCDVSTGEVVNRGPGTIIIGGSGFSGLANDEPTIEVKEFLANALSLDIPNADVDIQPCEGPAIRVTVSGPTSKVKRVTREVRGSTLFIEGKDRPGGGNSISISNVTINMADYGGIVSVGSIGGSSKKSPVQVTVELPMSTPIQLSTSDGLVSIGDTKSRLEGHISGIGRAQAGRVGSVDVKVSDTGRFTAVEVNGSVDVKVSDAGRVQIGGGDIDDLTIDTSGASNVGVGGVAQKAELDASGASSITVAHVVNQPLKHRSGAGGITVRRIG